MTLIEQLQQMQMQGYSDMDSIRILQEQGFSPKDISEAISQLKIKSAISSEEAVQSSVIQNTQFSQGEMQPSMINAPQPISGEPSQSSFQQYAGQEFAPPQPQAQEQYQQYNPQAPPQQSYEQYQQYAQSAGGGDTEMMSEIAEQVVSEKISEIKKAIISIADFKASSDAKIKDMEKRLKRIETIIDELQSSIIEKIGSFGKVMQDLRTELDTTQESFSKVVSPLFDKAREKSSEHKKRK